MNLVINNEVDKKQIDADLMILIELAAEAYQVFSALGNLTEDLRVLSFNAEFASGRAGAKGNCVRVLTQATRELVNALSRRYKNITKVCVSAKESALAVKKVFAADFAGALAANGECEDLRQFLQVNEQMASEMAAISTIAQECDGISVAIAVEAATAGVFREEFQQVADTMHKYVEELQDMITRVGRNVRRVREQGERLMGFLADHVTSESRVVE